MIAKVSNVLEAMAMNVDQKLEQSLKECEQLRKENKRLKNLLAKHHISVREPESTSVSKEEVIKQRIQIYKSLFKGRTDVYPERWESKNGRSGYSPACEHEWHPELCNKPKIKCSECKNRSFIPLTDKVIYDHLRGETSIGIYPLLKDDTCHFLAMDFDKKNWMEDAKSFLEVCKLAEIPAHTERSRSGNGCHVWIFFSEPVSASLARKLGNRLLEKTLTKRYQVGLDSFDRMFPNQDTLPKGGFGNLIALPLQRKPRDKGNSVFVDESFDAFPNQWEHMRTMKKVTPVQVDAKINELSSTQRSDQVAMVSSKSISVVLREGVVVEKKLLSAQVIDECLRLTSFSNPEFYKAQSQRLSTHRIPRKIQGFDEDDTYFIFPRGSYEGIIKILESTFNEVTINDQQNHGETEQMEFQGQLSSQQQEAVEELTSFSNGILSASTGFGKTVVAAALISKRKVNTLIIVHRKQLMEQWRERLVTFLGLDQSAIGQIGAGKNKPSGSIDIAMIQSLQDKEFVKNYGQIIVDECHHISAFSFEKVMKIAEAKYVHGLTATPSRKDGLHPIMTMQCGPIRYKVDAKNNAQNQNMNHYLKSRNTIFESKHKEGNKTIQKLYKELVHDEVRNELLFNDVLQALEEGRSPLILTERVEHVRLMERKLTGFAKNIIVLTGGLKKKQEQENFEKLKAIPANEERVIIATGKYIGEGFDDARLDSLFLALPVSWKGTLQQYVGRIHRSYDTKIAVEVYDYVDQKEPMLQRMFDKRMKGYKAMGYKLYEDKGTESKQMSLF